MSDSVSIFIGPEPEDIDDAVLLDKGHVGVTSIPTDVLQRNLSEFLESLKDIMPDTTPGETGYKLDGFDVAVGVSGAGKVGLFGTGVEAGASATLTLSFRRT